MLIKVAILIAFIALAFYRIRETKKRGIGLLDALGITFNKYSIVDAIVGGIVAGAIVSLMFLLEWRFNLLSVDGIESVSVLGTDISTPFVVSFIEELMFRAIVIGCLALWMRNASIIISISAIIFASAHLQNQNVNMLAFVGYFVGGIVYGIGYLRTGSLWLPMGLHLGWNYFQGRVCGFSLSGYQVPDCLILQHAVGSPLWTGGSYGFEGGVLGLVARLCMLLLILFWLRTKYSHSRNSSDALHALTGA